MEVKGKVKTIFPPEKLSFQDGRTYTQQLILLDCGEYSRGDDWCRGVGVVWHQGTRLHLHRQKRPSDRAHRIQRAPQRLRHSGGGQRAASARSSNRTRIPPSTTSPDASPHGSNASTTSRASAPISTDASATSAAGGHR